LPLSKRIGTTCRGKLLVNIRQGEIDSYIIIQWYGSDQYGTYQGIASSRSCSHPEWSENRPRLPEGDAAIERSGVLLSPSMAMNRANATGARGFVRPSASIAVIAIYSIEKLP